MLGTGMRYRKLRHQPYHNLATSSHPVQYPSYNHLICVKIIDFKNRISIVQLAILAYRADIKIMSLVPADYKLHVYLYVWVFILQPECGICSSIAKESY